MSDIAGPFRSVRSMARPLELARAVREGPWTDIDYQPIAVDKQFLAGAVPVLLDQVCDWWNSIEVVGDDPSTPDGQGHRWPDDRLAPMGRLPWPRVWVEWVDHDLVGRPSSPDPDAPRGIAFRIGALLTEHDPGEVSAGNRAMLPGADVFVSARVVLQAQSLPARIMPPIVWGAYRDGRFVRKLDGTIGFLCQDTREASPGFPIGRFLWDNLGVWRLFTALLSVRGTEAVDTTLPRNVRRQWARLKDGPAPWVTYKTLSIRLPASSKESEGGGGLASSPPPGVPLHLVRAFIADYRHGNGLFGKYKQLVWMPAHLRGHARLGAVAKTYAADLAASPDRSDTE